MESERYLALWQGLEPHLRLQLQRLVSEIEANGYTASAITEGGDEEFWLDVDFRREGEPLGGLRLQLTNPDVHGEEDPTLDLVHQGMGGRHLCGYRVFIEDETFDPARDSQSEVESLFAAPDLVRDMLYRLFLEPTGAPEPLVEDSLPF